MPVYWSMLIATFVLGFLSFTVPKKQVVSKFGTEYKTPFILAFLFFAYIVFFCSFRDVVLDTSAYISSFEAAPSKWSEFSEYVKNLEAGEGFYITQAIFKIIIFDNHYAWFAFLATITCACLLRTFYRYSIDFPLTAYLFISGAVFVWLVNGTRQFLAAAILFAFSDLLLEGKKFKYIIVALLVSLIHVSAIFVIPVCLFAGAKKIWGKQMILFIIITIIGTIYSESVFEFVSSAMEKNYTDSLEVGTGSNFLRLVIALVPVIIIILERKVVDEESDGRVILAANMSLVSACFYFASTFTNGILVGRMPIYFSLYNLYLLPWLLKRCFKGTKFRFMTLLCVAFYLIYFYYQLEVTWHGLTYISEFLNLYYF